MYSNRLLNRSNTYFIVLLILCVLLNSTQAVVLCAGCDGHLTVETARHHHCHNANDCQHESRDDADEYDTPCRLCVDIPLSPGIAKNSDVYNTLMTTPLFVGISPSNPGMDDLDRETSIRTGVNPAFTSFYNPLSSIILIV